jgi:ribosomal protein S27AE
MDHSTVSYSASRVEGMRDTDDIIKNYINRYEIMSKNKQVIDLCPPDYDVDREEAALRGFMCPKCSGRGYVMDYNGRDPERIGCPRCGGSGKLRAKVVIQWEAEE